MTFHLKSRYQVYAPLQISALTNYNSELSTINMIYTPKPAWLEKFRNSQTGKIIMQNKQGAHAKVKLYRQKCRSAEVGGGEQYLCYLHPL